MDIDMERTASRDVSKGTVVLPTGACEQHGPHLPLGTDSLIARGIGTHLAKRIDADLAPVLNYGISEHHMGFRGTVTIGVGAYVGFVHDILVSLARQGYKRIVILNGHGGNRAALRTAVGRFHEERGEAVYIFSWWDLEGVTFPDVVQDLHSGDIETSMALYLGMELVGEPVDEMTEIPPGYCIRNLEEVTRSGVLGEPTRATAKKGRRILEMVLDHIEGALEMRVGPGGKD